MNFKRIISSFVLYPLLFLLIFKGNIFLLFCVFLLIVLLCFKEFVSLFELFPKFFWGGAVILISMFICSFFSILPPISCLFLGLLFFFAVSLSEYDSALFFKKFLPFYFAPVYLFLGLYPILHFIKEDSRVLLFYLLTVVFAGDTGAYLIGKLLGRHPFAPSLSPKKTWEGFWGGVLFAVLVSLLLSSIFGLFDGVKAIILGILLAVSGALGDLFESSLKRAVGKKDSGRLIPGHGGLLDRIDGVLFAAPTFLAILKISGNL